MRYGFPYKGSKNFIAEWVCDNLPIAENFYDLFCGGCAVTHLQLLRGRYKRYFMNDIEPNGEFFLDCIHGKYTTENQKRWISRETFFAEKESNLYIKWCWSFGNNGRDYLYSKEKEPYKKELWLEWERTGKKPRELCKDGDRLKSLERLQSLTQLESLGRLQSLERDYAEVEILPDSVLYCDIPYINTDGYGKKKWNTFDYGRFYEWAQSQKELVVVSSYAMPEERFACVNQTEKRCILSATNNNKRTFEKIFVPKNQLAMYMERMSGKPKARQLEFGFGDVV